MTRLVLATRNEDKAAEFRALLGDGVTEVLTMESFPALGEIDEDGTTLEENALKKARTVFKATGLPSLADDSGLEVFYLNGAPGVYSARFSGPGATYESNCRKLLELMRGVPPRRRSARFRCVLAIVTRESEEVVEGVCHGRITESRQGTSGFGYDPVFVPAGHNRAFAEMNPEEKNKISHRALALNRLRPLLTGHL